MDDQVLPIAQLLPLELHRFPPAARRSSSSAARRTTRPSLRQWLVSAVPVRLSSWQGSSRPLFMKNESVLLLRSVIFSAFRTPSALSSLTAWSSTRPALKNSRPPLFCRL